MKDRTLQILTALVEDFIDTAIPVASKKLLESHEFKVSSATVRNEFAILESIGLIHSPHTSAGKVPTQQGYRYFVDELLDKNFAQKKDEKKKIQTVFQKHVSQYRFTKSKETLIDAVRLIAQLSGNVAFATIDNDRSFYLGLSNVLRSPEFIREPEKAAQIIEVLEGRERFQKFLQELALSDGEIETLIGDENILEEVSSCSIIVTRFKTKDIEGHLGILGPMRMRYGYNRELIRNVLEMIY